MIGGPDETLHCVWSHWRAGQWRLVAQNYQGGAWHEAEELSWTMQRRLVFDVSGKALELFEEEAVGTIIANAGGLTTH